MISVPKRYPTIRSLTTTGILTALTGVAHGAGFALLEQTVDGLGNAYAGGAAVAENASTVFFNPAGMTRIPKQQMVFGVHWVKPSAKFKNEGSTHVLQPVTGVPLLGGNGGDAGQGAAVPNLYLTSRINSNWFAGIGINSPFGLETDYDDGWVGRYYANKSELITLNINPALAYRVNEHLSLGAGLNAQYADAELTNAIDFGTIDVLRFGGAFGLTPQQSDGQVKLKGDSWGFGFNAGVLYEFNQNTRIGASYRSQIDQELDGSAEFRTPTVNIQLATGLFLDTNVKSDVTLPDSLSVSLYHRFNPRWAVMADYTWTNWSKLDELRFEFANPLQPDGVTTLEWEDSNRFAVGATFIPNGQWTLRMGAAYEETPVPNAALRTPRIPDNDRTWLTFGVGYRFNEALGFDIAYAHIFVDDPKIHKTATGENALNGGLNGTYDAHVNILSGQVQWDF